MSEIHIGCSGFNYADWRGVFYPDGLPQKRWFDYYCGTFSTVELNVTFYRLPLSRTFEKWYRETPSDFVFSLKGSRFISHRKRLLDPDEPLALFFERASPLQEKLKAVLWQFPPNFAVNMERLQRFLESLGRYPVRNALEFRHRSWLKDEVFDLCRTHNVSLCMADWPSFIDDLPITADFAYVRRHGLEGSYATSYSEDEIKQDAERITRFMEHGKSAYVYFNNSAFGYAPGNARELKAMIKG